MGRRLLPGAAGRRRPRACAPMLAAAMERKYSGNPGEGFFTGGGLHNFGNFSKLDDSRIMTVREALQQLDQPGVRAPDARRGALLHVPAAGLVGRAAGRRRRSAPRRIPGALRRPRRASDFLASSGTSTRARPPTKPRRCCWPACARRRRGWPPCTAPIVPERDAGSSSAPSSTTTCRRRTRCRPRRIAKMYDAVRAGQHVAGRPRLRRLDASARTVAGRLPAHPSEGRLDRSGRRPASRSARKSIRGCSRRTASTPRTSASPACSKSKPS